jgi:hypothetical protein
MKKKLLLVICLICSLNICAQENKLKIHSAEIGFGGFYFKKKISEGGGATFVADLTTAFGNNLISTSYLTGAEIGIVGNSNYNFDELRLQYGKEISVKKWIKFEIFAGLGYYIQNSEIADIKDGNAISFPLKLNTKFYFNKNFGMGLNSNYSINSINNNFSTNLIFHYKFN